MVKQMCVTTHTVLHQRFIVTIGNYFFLQLPYLLIVLFVVAYLFTF